MWVGCAATAVWAWWVWWWR